MASEIPFKIVFKWLLAIGATFGFATLCENNGKKLQREEDAELIRDAETKRAVASADATRYRRMIEQQQNNEKGIGL